MTVVFVHGMPETAAVWDGVRAAIGRDSLAVRLPGFGGPRPDAFGATKDDYVAWLASVLDALAHPVELVGHDWGAALVLRIAATRPELVRSWVVDVANVVHPGYEWHEFAQTLQRPGDGEALIAAQSTMPVQDLAAALGGMGLPGAAALEVASGMDEAMGSCILDLYRSATPNCFADWGPWVPTDAPGCVLFVSDDPFADERQSTEVAAMTGATVERIEGSGHFWPYEVPASAAAILDRFWAALAID
jgi:pimeloyl-ACP methyl ester carboxylesterase